MPPKKKPRAEPKLVVGPLTRLPKHAGSKVKISLKPSKKANYTAYQNIVVKIGADEYKYSEAWSLGAKGVPHDLFSVPEDLRDQLYFSDAKMWIEKGGVDSSYTRGKAHKSTTPWGTAKGRAEFRRIPSGAKVVRRKTTLRWNARGEMMAPVEKRKTLTHP
jgi:hypothetical protein